MRLIISAIIWDKALRADMRQVELIPLAREFGCVGVEFRPYWKQAGAEVSEIREVLKKHGLVCAYASNEVLLADSEEATRQALVSLRVSVGLAAGLGAGILRLNVANGPFNTAFIRSGWWGNALKDILSEARETGITLAVENGPDPLKGDAYLLRDILAAETSDTLRLTYDTGNWLYADMEPEKALAMLLPYIGYVHLKDIVSEDGSLKHSYPGTGLVNIKGLAEKIRASGYSGLYALEFPGGDNPGERVQQALKYLA